MARLFGTDGVRGLANRELTAELALDLAVAASRVLGENEALDGAALNGGSPHRLRAVLGRDPRASGEFLAAAVTAGLASAGVDVDDAGVLPTPAIARARRADRRRPGRGAVGLAQPDARQRDQVLRPRRAQAAGRLRGRDRAPARAAVGPADRGRRSAGCACSRTRCGRYTSRLLCTLPHRLDGLRVVVDCAHGAASEASPRALREAGADVVVIGAEPDGLNINDGYGSTHLDQLRDAVVTNGADAGIAHDGDADRCLAVDHLGREVDGDQIMAVLALAFAERGALTRNTLVTTVMSNLGLDLAMQRAGIRTVQTAVGDRYVLEEMHRGGYNLGGEQSGHVVMLDHATTGDGVLTGLQLLARVAETGRPLAELAAVMERLPQVLVNVPGVDKARAGQDPVLAAAVEAARIRLGGTGRVLLRPSGTEPLVRVMVEATQAEEARDVAQSLAGVVRERLGG